MCWTQFCWYAEPAGVLASLGSLPVTFPPAAFTPLPASEKYGSVACCAPYLPTEKPARLPRPAPSFATQSSMGMVIIGCAPAALEVEINVSPRSPATELASPMLSKYQSLARLSALACQL